MQRIVKFMLIPTLLVGVLLAQTLAMDQVAEASPMAAAADLSCEAHLPNGIPGPAIKSAKVDGRWNLRINNFAVAPCTWIVTLGNQTSVDVYLEQSGWSLVLVESGPSAGKWGWIVTRSLSDGPSPSPTTKSCVEKPSSQVDAPIPATISGSAYRVRSAGYVDTCTEVSVLAEGTTVLIHAVSDGWDYISIPTRPELGKVWVIGRATVIRGAWDTGAEPGPAWMDPQSDYWSFLDGFSGL